MLMMWGVRLGLEPVQACLSVFGPRGSETTAVMSLPPRSPASLVLQAVCIGHDSWQDDMSCYTPNPQTLSPKLQRVFCHDQPRIHECLRSWSLRVQVQNNWVLGCVGLWEIYIFSPVGFIGTLGTKIFERAPKANHAGIWVLVVAQCRVKVGI